MSYIHSKTNEVGRYWSTVRLHRSIQCFESAASGVIIESPVKFLWVGLIVESWLRVSTVE